MQREGAFATELFQPGMQVLDAGCGTGSITIDLARRVAPGTVVAVDLDAQKLVTAKHRAATAGVTNIAFVQDDVNTLGTSRSAAYDVIWMHAVLYHLRDPVNCLRRMFVLLREGGCIAIRDSYFPGNVAYPCSAEVELGCRFWEQLVTEEGGDPAFGAKQREALMQAGFGAIRVTASYDNFSQEEGVLARRMQQYLRYVEDKGLRELLLRTQGVSGKVLRRVEEGLVGWSQDARSVFLRCRCEAIGWKHVP